VVSAAGAFKHGSPYMANFRCPSQCPLSLPHALASSATPGASQVVGAGKYKLPRAFHGLLALPVSALRRHVCEEHVLARPAHPCRHDQLNGDLCARGLPCVLQGQLPLMGMGPGHLGG